MKIQTVLKTSRIEKEREREEGRLEERKHTWKTLQMRVNRRNDVNKGDETKT